MIDPRTLQQLRLLLNAGLINESVALLKSAGLSKAKSARALEEAGVGPGDAKRLVHESPVWAEVHERDEEFLAALQKAMEELDRSSKPQEP